MTIFDTWDHDRPYYHGSSPFNSRCCAGAAQSPRTGSWHAYSRTSPLLSHSVKMIQGHDRSSTQARPLAICIESSNVFSAVEIGQRHVVVSGGGSASFNVAVDSGVVALKGHHELGHLAVAFESSEAAFGFQGAGGAPPQDHPAALPSLHAA